MKAVMRTHPGKVRPSNQDAAYVSEQGFRLYAVADGMGGHRGGDVASAMAIEGLARLQNAEPGEQAIRTCFSAINQAIYHRQEAEESLQGMGTTLTLLWETDDSMLLGHVGDSRAYLYRQGRLYQVSRDHSLVGELLRTGVIDKDAAREYPYRHIITRAVGTDSQLACDTAVMDKLAGDRWLLCSDGLTDHVMDEEIQRCLALEDMDAGADELMELALDAGGQDNITLVLLEVIV
ncbi:MAG: Stp1/IreP family PP2C-type Ser/Thr phosphatase [Christensenellales bacterium]|jgi:serine/threonine protein phosphatase PrpC